MRNNGELRQIEPVGALENYNELGDFKKLNKVKGDIILWDGLF
jgi:hypothetical protein